MCVYLVFEASYNFEISLIFILKNLNFHLN